MKLRVEGLGARYDDAWILRGLALGVSEGEFVSVVGPSGCGKSTLLSLIAGLLPLEEGRIMIDGREVRSVSPQVSLMPQDDLLLPWLTVLDNACLYGKVHGKLSPMRTEARARLKAFGLEGWEGNYPHQLSGGMRQRAAFLRTALCPTDILLLDEPFASLDVITREEMQDWLLHIHQTLGRTVLLVTHDIDEAIYLSDRVLVLGGQPGTIQKAVSIQPEARTRAWLFRQGELRQEIYHCLKGGAHHDF